MYIYISIYLYIYMHIIYSYHMYNVRMMLPWQVNLWPNVVETEIPTAWPTPSSSASVMVDVNPPIWLSDVCGLPHFHSRILSMEIWWYVGIAMETLVNLLHFDKAYGNIKSYIHVSEYMSCPHAVAYIHPKHVCYQVASRIPPNAAWNPEKRRTMFYGPFWMVNLEYLLLIFTRRWIFFLGSPRIPAPLSSQPGSAPPVLHSAS